MVRALKSVEMSEVMISQVRCDIVNVPGVCMSVAGSLSAQPIALRRTGVPNTPLERC